MNRLTYARRLQPVVRVFVRVFVGAFMVAVVSLFSAAGVGIGAVNRLGLSRVEAPAGCSETVNEAKRRLTWLLGVNENQVDFPVVSVCQQAEKFPGAIDFLTAVDSAFWSILNDGQHPESILALATILAFEDSHLPWSDPLPERVLLRGRLIAKQHISSPSTRVRLLQLDECAEAGECVGENWIFRIKVPTLSDHIHYVVVERQGIRPVYNYGFN